MVLSKLLDLPNELLVEIFQYFEVGQLFHSLFKLTTRLDNLLKQYHPHHWNLDNTENLNLVCRYINPEQIRSLVVQNSEQMNVFEKLFENEQFLMIYQALTVYDTTPYDFIFIVRRLPQFKNLLAFSAIRSSPMTYTGIHYELLGSVINNEIPTLKYLKLLTPQCILLSGISQVSSTSIPSHLEHLILSCSPSTNLSKLFQSLPNLIDISIYILSSHRIDWNDCIKRKYKREMIE
jgi:hypothetical protein